VSESDITRRERIELLVEALDPHPPELRWVTRRIGRRTIALAGRIGAVPETVEAWRALRAMATPDMSLEITLGGFTDPIRRDILEFDRQLDAMEDWP